MCLCVCSECACQYVCLMKTTSGEVWSWALSPGEEAGASGAVGRGPWFSRTAPQSAVLAAGDGGWGGSRCCCQTSSDITRATPLIFTAISDGSRLCFQTQIQIEEVSRDISRDGSLIQKFLILFKMYGWSSVKHKRRYFKKSRSFPYTTGNENCKTYIKVVKITWTVQVFWCQKMFVWINPATF